MGRIRHSGRGRDRRTGPLFAIAVGIGMLLAICFSPRLALFLAAIILIYVGVTYR